jgi:hypothetical protein
MFRNTLNNCGIRHLEYGTKRTQQNTRKRGINMLISIMSQFGRNLETESKVCLSNIESAVPVMYIYDFQTYNNFDEKMTFVFCPFKQSKVFMPQRTFIVL